MSNTKSFFVALLALIGVAAFLQVGRVQPQTTSSERIPNGTSGRVILDQFTCADNRDSGFVNIELAIAWTEATLEEAHSTLLHLGQTEKNGIRLDLGKSTTNDGLSYYLVVGSYNTLGYQVYEFLLDQVDYGVASISLLVANEFFRFKLETPSNKQLTAEGKSSQVSCEYIYLGEGPPGLVPGFTDIALYPSNAINSSIVIEQGRNLTVSRFNIPTPIMKIARSILILALIVTLLFVAWLAIQKLRLMRFLSALRSLNPISTFLLVCFFLWILVIPTWWIQAGYKDIPVTEKMSFTVGDGWCNPEIQGVGRHCFSDFQSPQAAIDPMTPLVYTSEYIVYPPTSFLPFVVVDSISKVLNTSDRATLWIYIGLSALALSVPGIYVLRKRQDSWRFTLGFLLGPSSLPAMLVLDRGNNIAFVVPLVLFYGVLIRDKRYLSASLALAAAVSIKPQLVFLFLVLLGLRKIRMVMTGILASAVLLVGGFIVWPGNPYKNLAAWIRNLTAFSDFPGIMGEYPARLSATHVAHQLSGILNLVELNPTVVSLVLLLIVATTCWFRGRHMNFPSLFFLAAACTFLIPSLTFAYYLVVLLPAVAILVTSVVDTTKFVSWSSDHVVAVVAAISMVPLPIAIGNSPSSVTPHFSGLLCLAAVLMVVSLMWIPNRGAKNLSRSTRSIGKQSELELKGLIDGQTQVT